MTGADAAPLAVVPHVYLSTACLHGVHDYCRSEQSRCDGHPKAPGRCKFCPAVCLCPVCRHHGATSAPSGRPRAFYRGYPDLSDRRSKRVTRLHVLREDGGPFRGRPAYAPARPVAGWCGTSAGRHSQSEPVVLDPMPAVPPTGLSWCASCIGHLAEQLGQLAGFGLILSTVGT